MTATKLLDKARPTNTDLMRALREVHECVHIGAERTEELARTVSEDRHRTNGSLVKLQAQAVADAKTSATAAAQAGERMARLEGSMEALLGTLSAVSQSMGIKPTADDTPPKPVKRFGSQRPLTVALQVLSASSAGLATAHYAVPTLEAAGKALWSLLSH